MNAILGNLDFISSRPISDQRHQLGTGASVSNVHEQHRKRASLAHYTCPWWWVTEDEDLDEKTINKYDMSSLSGQNKLKGMGMATYFLADHIKYLTNDKGVLKGKNNSKKWIISCWKLA